MTVTDVATAAGLSPGRNSGAEVLYTCPNHDDAHPSLSLNPNENCWMCGSCGKHGTPWALAAFLAGVEPDDKSAVKQWLNEHGLSVGNGTKSVSSSIRPTTWHGHTLKCWYEYKDFSVARVEHEKDGERKKEFPVFARGSWGLNGKGIDVSIYRQSEIPAAGYIFIAEGEKAVDALRSIGLSATCSPGG